MVHPVRLRFPHLPGHGHGDDLAEAGVVEAVEAGDLTARHVAASLGHHADASLWVGGLERVDVVDVRRLRRDLKVADHTVPLRINNNRACLLRQKWISHKYSEMFGTNNCLHGCTGQEFSLGVLKRE